VIILERNISVSFSFSQIIIRYFRKKKYGKIKSYQELSIVEKKILEDISVGKSYNTIAEELSISREDVQKYIRMIYEKLQDKSSFKNSNNYE
jgi:DNA-binding CsgD family transcriptional regulator